MAEIDELLRHAERRRLELVEKLNDANARIEELEATILSLENQLAHERTWGY